DGQPARRPLEPGRRPAALGCRSPGRPRRVAPPLRQADARPGPKNGPHHCPRPRSPGRTLPSPGSTTGPGEVSEMHFAQPGWLWLRALMPLPWLRGRSRPRIAWPGFEGFPQRRRIGWVWLRALPAVSRGLAIGGLAVALARPQTVGGVTRIAGQGVAIV